MSGWDEVVDLVVIGSGGGGLTAALVAHERGLTAIVVEKQAMLGGSTAMSGGVLWLPCNPLLERAGVPDDLESARAYLDALASGDDTENLKRRREAFLRASPRMVEFLEAQGLRFYWCDGYSDYYDDLPGGCARGRAIAARMLPDRQLGDWRERLLQLPGWNLPVQTDEFAALSLAGRTWRSRLVAARVSGRLLWQRLTGSRLLCRGGALQARMLLAIRRAGVRVVGQTAVAELVTEGDEVAGVIVEGPDGRLAIGARRGVLINAGGFARNREMRERYHPQPTSTSWTLANQGDTGEVIAEAMRIGAATANMDEAWWLPVSLRDGRIAGFHSPQEMQKPFLILVDARGERFVNESASYMEIGQAMYRRRAVPAWAIFEARHRRYYPWGVVPPRVIPKSWVSSGYMKSADTLEELAAQCGIDPGGLVRTVERFNEFARQGHDPDFRRGARAYDRVYADPRQGPNPTLGPIEQAPFYAVAIYPGDVGTAGGLVVDEHARVLRADGSPIRRLYACGNSTASLFGRWYPGPGASIGASFVFGYIAANHAASEENV